MAQEINTTGPKNKALKIILAIVSLIVILVTGIGIGSFLFSDSFENSFFSDFMTEAEASEVSVPLDQFIVNLSTETSRQPVVRIEMTVTSTDESIQEVISEDIAKIRDAVIHTVSRETMDTILNESDGEFEIKEKVKNRINQVLGKDMIDDVYITNILLQK
ncbi:hypothetical protein GCM10008932_13350 [Alkalibacterium iburiense]|uniref:Flagellar protein FliL n=1 Tax=Alkalibacterium iburiense TaxID=290589 RepID=A0ABN0XEG9_9LACT